MANLKPPVILDELDQRLVEALQQNARATVTELGQGIHLGTSATRARLNTLEERGVITGHTAHVSPAALGYTLHAVVRMKVHGALYDKIAEVLHRQPQIVRALRITGESCYSLEILATDMADLERITTDLAHVGSITTDLVYETVTDRPTPTPRQREQAKRTRHDYLRIGTRVASATTACGRSMARGDADSCRVLVDLRVRPHS